MHCSDINAAGAKIEWISEDESSDFQFSDDEMELREDLTASGLKAKEDTEVKSSVSKRSFSRKKGTQMQFDAKSKST